MSHAENCHSAPDPRPSLRTVTGKCWRVAIPYQDPSCRATWTSSPSDGSAAFLASSDAFALGVSSRPRSRVRRAKGRAVDPWPRGRHALTLRVSLRVRHVSARTTAGSASVLDTHVGSAALVPLRPPMGSDQRSGVGEIAEPCVRDASVRTCSLPAAKLRRAPIISRRISRGCRCCLRASGTATQEWCKARPRRGKNSGGRAVAAQAPRKRSQVVLSEVDGPALFLPLKPGDWTSKEGLLSCLPPEAASH